MGAGLKRRFLARLIDAAILTFLLVAGVMPIVFGPMNREADGGVAAMALVIGFGLFIFLSSIISTAYILVYFTVMESNLGWTVGKLITGLRVRGPDSENPSSAAALKRNLWHLAGLIPFLGSLVLLGTAISIAVTISSSEKNTGWHDTFAGGTRVVRAS